MQKLYIIIPAYNEASNIQAVISAWHPVAVAAGPASKLVVIDDGSKDATYQIAAALKAKYPQMEVVTKPNSGHGPTCLFGYRYAIESGADYVFQTDSDGQTDPAEFRLFWEQREGYHFIIGTRCSRQDGIARKFVTNILRLVLLATASVDVRDANTPYRLMNARVLARYLEHIPADFFLGNALLSTMAVKRHDSVKWLPITFKPRQGGENSLNMKRIVRIGLKAVWEFAGILHKEKEFLNGEHEYALHAKNSISR